MKREELTELVRSAAVAAGYAFYVGEEHLINGIVRACPAVWLTPPTVRSHTGRREGETTWRITMYLMTLPSGDATAETLWEVLERDALSMVCRLADSPAVCAVQNVGCVSTRGSLTVHGETSLALTCDVTMWYYI